LENILVPDQAVTNIPCTHALVFAPHPDDEVFGCGGAIMRHVEQGVPVCVIVVTDGAHGVSEEKIAEYTTQRQNESIAAAKILGYDTPTFWQYRDREICYNEKLIQEVMTAIAETKADLVYAPSIFEMHPDHRALGMAVVEAVRRISKPLRLALYEVGIPLHPNQLLDISDLAARKTTAMACFTSQNAKQRYDLHIAALNRYRTYTLPASVTAAEAYMLMSAEELADDPFKLYQSEHTRQKALGLALDSRDAPLVSVITRSMDRPTLSDALDSIALQTYANIEVVVVNAKGPIHKELDEWCGRFPLRLVASDQQLNRSSAANIGLEAAKGEYLIFLDDDDLFYPEHITDLVAALQKHKNARCTYAGIRIEHYTDGQLETVTELNEPFDRRRLWGGNFIPIHAMLFERSLIIDGCRFDEDLEIFEDWDLWFQLAQRTEILHIDKISAIYRNHGHSGMGLKHDKAALRKSRGKFYDKWKALLTGEQLDDLVHYQKEVIANLRSQLTHNENLINRLTQNALASTDREKALNKTIDDLLHSTSWKITAPLRFFARMMRGQHRQALAGLRSRLIPLLKIVYWHLPAWLRSGLLNVAYRVAGPLFTGLGHYEMWRIRTYGALTQFLAVSEGHLAGMVDVSSTTPLTSAPPGRIAIHAHIFYADLAAEFAGFLRNMPFPYDLFVSTPDEATCNQCKQAFSNLPRLTQLTVTIVPNRGRDIAPMFCAFGETLQGYDYICHIHSKKSLYNKGATDGWREYLLTNLLGSESQIRRIFALLTGDQQVGFVYPQNFSGLPYLASTWLSNKACGRIWCNKLGITNMPIGYFDFPAGSMFWTRSEALQPLFNTKIKIEDFPEEAGQNDATLAHCLERLLVLVTRQAGLNTLILRDTQSNSWSRWRFEQYLARKQEHIQAMLTDPALHLIIFDIFDTLLLRPLLNPEDIKCIIAQRAGGKTGKLYLELRAIAEAHARQKAGRDIDLDAIFEELSILSGLSSESIAQLRRLEETVEMASVTPRPEAIALLQSAVNSGKRVVLASDMYLPKSTVETMLRDNNITAWHQLYLSSDIGLRKDTGDLYRHILDHEQVAPNAVMVIGDNEHSDIQIPGDMEIKYLHVLRPVELARAIPRLGPLIERSLYKNDVNLQLTLGMLVRDNFQPLFFPNFDPSDLVPATPWAIGYTVAGPLVLSFVQWLAAKASADGVQHLHFLAREGQILKMVYDRWFSNDANAITADYLVLSRRAVTVPMISNLEDILEIARVNYSHNCLSEFIQVRFGLTLSQEECDDFAQRKLWPKNKLVSVENKNVDHLIPLLQALEQRILAQAQDERPGLMAYLNDMGLNTNTSSAIVDIGYAATIQGRLNRLMNQTIHGYYMVTEKRAESVSSQYGVITQGCFGHYVNAFDHPPLIFVKSFSLEKLLSSDEAQIVCYRLGDSGDTSDILPEFRHLTEEERQTKKTRTEIRRGIMDFVAQSIIVRDKLTDDFLVPPDIATALFETLIENPSSAEQAILGALTLDDHYCGHGLVS
jgi:LmbE family N-acetylglucosaminyl deacetylase/predicted HAD superfamily hydrolase/glycosyltransferase involved in cell wall biosynthesis